MARRKRKVTLDDIRLGPGGIMIAAPAWAYDRSSLIRTSRGVVSIPGLGEPRQIEESWDPLMGEVNAKRREHIASERASQAAWPRRSRHEFHLGQPLKYPESRHHRQCSVCRKDFYGLGNVTCCTEKCARTRRDATRTRSKVPRPHVHHDARPCPQCGEPFTPRRSDAVYCSLRCRVAHHRINAR